MSAVEKAAEVLTAHVECGWVVPSSPGAHLRHVAEALSAAGLLAEPGGLVQVGWLGPYGLIPGGMDNDPAPHWRPVYVRREVVPWVEVPS